MITLIGGDGQVNATIGTALNLADAFVPEVHNATEVVALIAGKPFAGIASPGLATAIAPLMAGVVPDVRCVLLSYAMRPPLSFFGPDDEPVLLCGHSFGGFAAWVCAMDLIALNPERPVHLIMCDPVAFDDDLTDGLQEDWSAQWRVNQIPMIEGLASAKCLLCSAIDPIRNSHMVGVSGDVNEVIAGTDHNSLLLHPRTLQVIADKAREVFGRAA